MAKIRNVYKVTLIRTPHFITHVIIQLIRIYQLTISPFLGSRCRFYPSCSCYSQIALTRYGLVKGIFLTLKRLLRCHPFHSGGIDQVP